MGLLTRMQDVVKETALLFTSSNKTMVDALTKINQDPPTYTANDLTHDITQISLQTLLVWMKFWNGLADPVLPTLVISAAHDKIAGKSPSGRVSLADPIPVAGPPAITVTPLVFAGWSQVPKSKDASQVPPLSATVAIPASDPLRQDLVVTLNVPAGAPDAELGLYQGFVMVATNPVAVVVVQST